MFTVKCDGHLLFDLKKHIVLTNPQLNIAENAAGSLEFDIDPEHPLYDSIEMMVSEIIVYRDGTEIWSGRPVEVHTSFFGMRSIYCEGALAYLNDTIQEPTQYKVEGNLNIYNWLALRLEEHNRKAPASRAFYVGRVTVTEDDVLYRYTNYENTLDCIKDKLVDRLGGYLQIRRRPAGGFFLDYLKDYEHTSTQQIRFGLNLLEYSRTLTRADIATVCVPFGVNLDEKRWDVLDTYLDVSSKNNGSIYVESPEGIANFGRIIKVVHWNEITTASALLRKAQDWLTNAQFDDLKLEVNAMDFHLADSAVPGIDLLDEVRVVSPPHGLDRYFPVTEMKIPLDNPAGQVFTLGASERVSLTTKTNNGLKDLADELTQTASSVLIRARENATELITSGALGGHVVVLPDEIYIGDNADIDSMRKVWRWNSGGLGYSSEGRNGTYNTAITADGQIVADRITTGTLSADRIRGGTIRVGGSDYGNGSISVKNAAGNIIGKWDSGGIEVKAGKITGGTIQGATIIAGGSNNSEGTITVKNATGTVVGTWNNSGINVTSGSINGANVTVKGSRSEGGGFISVYNGNTEIGRWDKDGIVVTKGSITGGTIQGAKIIAGGANDKDGTILIRDANNNQAVKLNVDGINVSKGTIQGATIKGNAISGGTISGTTISGSTLSGNTISGNTVNVGGNNDKNGTINVYAADGTTKNIILNKSGITVNAGTIKGTSITLGNKNNGEGSLTVKNASGTTVGTFDQNGITIKQGSITLGSNFSVTSAGILTAKNGVFTGTVSGSTIIIGGKSSAGSLVIKDSSDKQIGRWTKDGLVLSSKCSIGSTSGNFFVNIDQGNVQLNKLMFVNTNADFSGSGSSTAKFRFYHSNSSSHMIGIVMPRAASSPPSMTCNADWYIDRSSTYGGTLYLLSDRAYIGSGNASRLEVNKNQIDGTYGITKATFPRALYAGTARVAVESSSASRYKHDIVRNLTGDRNAHNLLRLPVAQFVFNDDHTTQYEDMAGKTIPGIIAEDVEKYYPSAVIHDNEGKIESWDERRIIPAMLFLIQEMYTEITKLKEAIA